MLKSSFSRVFGVSLVSLVALGATSQGNAAVVLANNPAPGDSYTNAGGSNQGQAVGGTGWYYNNVRNGGTVGISTDNPRSGNGSVALSGTAGPGGASHKADIEYLPNAVNFGGNYFSNASLGSLSSLSSMSYDWYRDSSSTANANQHPALRVLLDADGNLNTTGDRGGLVFELVYNGVVAAPTDSWVSSSVTSSTYLWNFGLGVGSEFNINATAYAYDATLAEWQAYFPNAAIIGFSSGIGSGWGPFEGAVDNIAWTIGTAGTQTSNFEVERTQVPAPGGLLLLGIGMMALTAVRRRAAAR